MSNQEILDKAIQKAVDGGWHTTLPINLKGEWDDELRAWMYYDLPNGGYDRFALESVIFNHDFAKALWGDAGVGFKEPFYNGGVIHNWEMHLQQMVIADDPIQYLGVHLNG